MKMEEMEMSLSFHMWNLQEEIVSLAPLVKEQEEFLGVCVHYIVFPLNSDSRHLHKRNYMKRDGI